MKDLIEKMNAIEHFHLATLNNLEMTEEEREGARRTIAIYSDMRILYGALGVVNREACNLEDSKSMGIDDTWTSVFWVSTEMERSVERWIKETERVISNLSYRYKFKEKKPEGTGGLKSK
jgi:hypothetical protein